MKRVERAGVLNIQPLAVRSSLHSPSSLECEKGKVNNEKMQFAHTIIQDMYKIETYQLNFCVDIEEVGVQMSKQDQELH